MNKKTVFERGLLYFMLAVLCFIAPYLAAKLRVQMMIMSYSTVVAIKMLLSVLIHLYFSFVFLQTKRSVKLITPLCTAVASWIAHVIIVKPFFHLIFYLCLIPVPSPTTYRLLPLVPVIASIIAWEVAYHVLLRIDARKSLAIKITNKLNQSPNKSRHFKQSEERA